MFISVYCQVCADECRHEIMADTRERLIRCTVCGSFQRIKKEKVSGPISVNTIVSREGVSIPCEIELLAEDECSEGDHLVAECGDEAFGVEVTGIETEKRRAKKARAKEIITLWTRVIDQVVVKVSIHYGRRTIPLYMECDGEDFFVVGEIRTINGKRFKITQLKLRDGPLMRKEGWKTIAHRLKRVYGRRL